VFASTCTLAPMPVTFTDNAAFGTSVGAGGFVSGTFNTGSGATGCYEEQVYVTGSGTLNFLYWFSVDASSTDPIEGFSGFNFKGFAISNGNFDTDGDNDGDGGGVLPSGQLINGGGQPHWDFGCNTTSGCVSAGKNTDFLFVLTSSTSFGGGSVSFQDGQSVNEPGLAPVPEPASMALFGSGLLGLAGVIRRKLRK
jgi:hypothetical protein